MSDTYYYIDAEHSLPALLQKIKAYFVSKTRKVNGHALTEDITLTPEDLQCCTIKARTVTLASGSWSSKVQKVTLADVGANSSVIVSPTPAHYLNWHKYKVRCSGQGAGWLNFATDGAPPNLEASVLIIDYTT